jgi:hypothetical protein
MQVAISLITLKNGGFAHAARAAFERKACRFEELEA